MSTLSNIAVTRLLLMGLALAAPLCGCQCASDQEDRLDAGALDGGGGGAGGGSCADGEACGDGGVCAGGSCCASAHACGGACCQLGQRCSYLRCVTPQGSCFDDDDCEGAEVCELSGAEPAAYDGGACVTPATPGQCLPAPPRCPPDAGAAAGLSCVLPCRFTRPPGTFDPVVKYAWGEPSAPGTPFDVMMAPIVAQLTDDDCDGRLTSRDQPEIVVVTFASGQYTQLGVVHALTVRGGALVERWATPGFISAASQLASGDIDGAPGNEVVGCAPTGPVALNGSDGSLRWQATGEACTVVSLADLEGDGRVEVVTERQIFDGQTGQLLRALPSPGNNAVADIDGDGQQEVALAAQVVRADATVLAEVAGPAGFVAVGDLDLDGRPEIVSVDSSTHTLALWSFDPSLPGKGRLVRSGLDINQTLSPTLCPPGSSGRTRGGGPPTIGDFNADGYPDVALAGGVGYAVFDGRKLMDPAAAAADTLLWIRQTQDCSSAATGSTLFDFDGDGRVEAVYGDELNLRVYDSATGEERFSTCNTSGTLIEYPLVADVDNDDQADLVVVSNAYAFACTQPAGQRHSGVRVFSSASGAWMVTRRVWNQHAYSVTNIEEDGRVPSRPAANWTTPGLNNFRQNKQPGREFAAPDAVVSLAAWCSEVGVTYEVTVTNVGEATLPRGTAVELVLEPASAPAVLASLTTTRALAPTQAERLRFDAPSATASKQVLARVVATGLRQCRSDNDTAGPSIADCIE